MDKKYIDREKAMEIVRRTNGDYVAAWSEIRQLPAADVTPVVHGDIERARIEAILKKHGTYLLSTIDGQGCHVGCYKGIALDADGKWIIEADVESMSETNCGDFIPVVHGYWINTPPYRAVNGSYKKGQECSVCNAFYVSDGNTPYSNHPYCAECGAKMDGPVRRWTDAMMQEEDDHEKD